MMGLLKKCHSERKATCGVARGISVEISFCLLLALAGFNPSEAKNKATEDKLLESPSESVRHPEEPLRKQGDEESLRQDYHRLESFYRLSRILPRRSDNKALLQQFSFSGGIVLTPGMQLEVAIPTLMLGGAFSLTNPYLGLSTMLFEGLINDFPTFVSLKGGAKLPLASDHEFVFDRTDIVIGISSLREIYYLALSADLSYILKMDPEPLVERYGNELAAALSVEINTPFHLIPGFGFHYRRGGAYQYAETKVPGQSLFILNPYFSYPFGPDMILKSAFAIPIGRQNARDRLRVFGDYTIPGIGGNTFSLAFEKRF